MSKFKEGQQVRCINNNFPWLKKHGGTDEGDIDKPKIKEVLIIDEVLGEFIRFEHYDTSKSYNWWTEKNFEPISDKEKALREAVNKHELIIN